MGRAAAFTPWAQHSWGANGCRIVCEHGHAPLVKPASRGQRPRHGLGVLDACLQLAHGFVPVDPDHNRPTVGGNRVLTAEDAEKNRGNGRPPNAGALRTGRYVRNHVACLDRDAFGLMHDARA